MVFSQDYALLENVGQPVSPRIIPRAEHHISRSQISPNALKVLYRLHENGYDAYLVGGGVRDLMLGREPKDFDIATNATPEEVRGLFKNCRLIGRRFRLAHIRYGREIIEVATFRAPHDEAEHVDQAHSEDGRILRDNVYGTLEQDVWRRDFTINALYYNIADFSVVDYTGGVEDLNQGMLHLIGDPIERYKEDPVRMLRAVRFAAKLGFNIDKDSENAIHDLGGLLKNVSPARVFDEMLKLFHGGCAAQTFELLRHYDLFQYLFPETDAHLDSELGEIMLPLISRALNNTDQRIQDGKPVNPAFLIAILLWHLVVEKQEAIMSNGVPPFPAMQQAGQQVMSAQIRSLSIPKRFSLVAKEIWIMQLRLPNRRGKRPLVLLAQQRFRAAYDFLCLRGQSGEDELQEVCEWWTRFQEQNPEDRNSMLRSDKRRKRRPRKRKSRSPDA
ncbi:MAG TPA: polynucleotide adenylyltransferase PcnB [Chromatiales bacterium]|nr:polynucleotide adenylyltransferase PcnB [Thiotrichales bacterium]HIP68693.1 polynucleotide adenylyltransferase PcnB [Chromatiales bacterium]